MASRIEQLMSPRKHDPLVKQRTALLTIVGFWLFYIAISALRAAVLNFPEQFELASRRMVVAVTGMFITWLMYRAIIFFDRKPLASRIAVTFLAAIPAAFAIAVINHLVFNVIDPMSLFEDPQIAQQVDAIEQQLGYSVWQDILESAITLYYFLIAWASLFLALGYAYESSEAERMSARYANAAHDAEMRSLRYQVNPQFTFQPCYKRTERPCRGYDPKPFGLLSHQPCK
jgi:two-component system, LytTR family, sensor kinase